ncbi:ankyrin-1-like [Haliotis rubra]|uniref:ankyrin-1-like n=1 Tax=Haliotis rubra TaxID=36100 RepID=UPI001EE584FE|nr:ankyrin-1-like [Haliotis rubra]
MLHVVCKVGNIELVNYLIGKGIDIQTKDTNGNTALHAACARGHFEIAKVLIEKGLSFNEKNTRAMSPLDLAIINTHYGVTCVYDHWYAVSKCHPGISMISLHHICRDNKIQLLYNSEIVFAEKDSDGNSALHVACEERSEEIVQLLIIAGAWLLVFNNHGEAPVHIACHGPCLKAMIDAIHKKIKVKVLSLRDKNGNTPLHLVIRAQNLGNLCILLDNNVDVEMVNSFHQTALHIACYGGNVNVVEKLLGAGASVIAVDKKWSRKTPLYNACSSGSANIVKLILQESSLSSVSDSNNMTPLHVASWKGHVDVVKLLLESDHDLQAKTNDGQTALHLSCLEGHRDVAEVLLKAGSDINALDSALDTPLHLAARAGVCDVVVLQAKWGARDTQCNKHGKTALHVACHEGHTDAVKALLNMGSDILATNN